MSTTPPQTSSQPDWWFWGLLMAAALLLLPNLQSSGLLWQDEAETAVLGQNILQFGYPKVFDGVNRINPALTAGPWDSWAYHPWLPFYLTAASFAAFGVTTVAARLPFALLGVIGVLLTYRVTLRLFHHQGIARLASLLTVGSVPLMLHARQCRYYTPVLVATLWVLWAYVKIRDGHRAAWWALAAGLILLFHTHHGAFIPTAAVLLLDGWRRGLWRGSARVAIPALAVAAAAILPWFWILDVAQHQGTFSVRELRHHIQFYLRQLNHFIVPLQFFLVVWLCRGIRPLAWWRAATWRQREMVRLLGLIVAANLLFIIAVPWQRHFRYLIHLLPLIYLLEAILLWGWLGRRPLWRWGIVALILTTDLLHYSAPYIVAQQVPRLRAKILQEHGLVRPESLLAHYAYELTHHYRGPLEGIVETLQDHARPGETVKIPYDDHVVIFYTGLKVEDLNRFTAPTFPSWIIPRRDWVPSAFYQSPYFQEIEQRYERIEVDAPDLVWQNRPDPGYHKFRSVENAPRIVLYHRRDDAL